MASLSRNTVLAELQRLFAGRSQIPNGNFDRKDMQALRAAQKYGLIRVGGDGVALTESALAELRTFVPPKPRATPRGTPTDTNIFALSEYFIGRDRSPNRIASVSVPHIRRCLDAGLCTVEGSELVLTPEGKKAIEERERRFPRSPENIERTKRMLSEVYPYEPPKVGSFTSELRAGQMVQTAASRSFPYEREQYIVVTGKPKMMKWEGVGKPEPHLLVASVDDQTSRHWLPRRELSPVDPMTERDVRRARMGSFNGAQIRSAPAAYRRQTIEAMHRRIGLTHEEAASLFDQPLERGRRTSFGDDAYARSLTAEQAARYLAGGSN